MSRIPAALGVVFTLSALCAAMAPLRVPATDLSVRVEVESRSRALHPATAGKVVIWLNPEKTQRELQVSKTSRFRLVQKDKSFVPHLLVIPVGSSVEFPNRDPFFHNVFSLFNGKRFDLGLYESGSTRIVHFDREGVSYVFCNIHPEMGAVIIALATPYFGISAADGTVSIRGVPPGTYEMNLWSEGSSAGQLNALRHTFVIAASQKSLGTIRVREDTDPAHHKNKFGEDYPASLPPLY